MFGPVLPVELVTSARRARYFVVRVLYAAVLLVTLWWQYEMTFGSWVRSEPVSISDLAAFAREFLDSFAIVQLLAVLLLTPAMIAGTIAEEKERKTIEYLLVTDLSKRELVLGKLAARLLHLGALTAVGLPVLSLTMLFGGVALENLLGMFAITVATMFTLAALSIWASVEARRARDAVTRVFVIGLVLLVLPPVVREFSWPSQNGLPLLEAVLEPLLAANPFVCLIQHQLGEGLPDWERIGELVRNQAVLALPCAALAVWRVRRGYLEQAYGKVRRARPRAIRLWRPALGDAPVRWKELFAERPIARLGVVGTVAQAVLFLAVLVPSLWLFTRVVNWGGTAAGWDREGFRYYIASLGTALVCLALLIIALCSANAITSERERQTWDVLLSTPLEPGEIITGKIWGSLAAARGVIFLVIVLWVLGLMAQSVGLLAVSVVALEVSVLAMFAAQLGLLFSLHLKSSLWSMAATAGTCVFLGGGYLFCCFPLMLGGGSSGEEFIMAGCVPVLVAFPMVIEPGSRTWDHVESRFVAACVIGTVFYFLAALVLWGVAVQSFDELAGRGARIHARGTELRRKV